MSSGRAARRGGAFAAWQPFIEFRSCVSVGETLDDHEIDRLCACPVGVPVHLSRRSLFLGAERGLAPVPGDGKGLERARRHGRRRRAFFPS